MPHPALRRTPARRRFDHGAPISAIDTRPMVFVALFVTVVFLLGASQTRTHALMVDLPFTLGEPVPTDGPTPVIHRIRVTEADTLMFDGKLVTEDELLDLLHRALSAPLAPRIAFEPDANASYNLSVQTLALIRRSGALSSLFCLDGLEQHRHFGKGGGAPFPVLFSFVPPDPLTEPPPFPTKFESCTPEQLVSFAWMH